MEGCNTIFPSKVISISVRFYIPLMSGRVRQTVHPLALLLVSQSQSDAPLLVCRCSTSY